MYKITEMKKYLMPLYNWFSAAFRRISRMMSFRTSNYHWDKKSNEVLFI